MERFVKEGVIMSELTHLQTQIHMSEDALLRTRDVNEANKIMRELVKMRLKLQKMEYRRRGPY